jgi:RimJ/RimL family protein N-acetyltransferase
MWTMHAITRLDPRLITERLMLRPYRAGDVAAIVEKANDFQVSSMLVRVPFPYTLADGEKFLALAEAGAEAGTDLTLVVEREREPIGCIGIADIAGTAELGYWLGRNHWGKGYATEAARAFLAYAFAALRVRIVRSGAFADNPASLAVQAKLGFAVTGNALRFSLARGQDVEHVDTILTRTRFREANQ